MWFGSPWRWCASNAKRLLAAINACRSCPTTKIRALIQLKASVKCPRWYGPATGRISANASGPTAKFVRIHFAWGERFQSDTCPHWPERTCAINRRTQCNLESSLFLASKFGSRS